MPARSLILGSFLLVLALPRAAAAKVPGPPTAGTANQADAVKALEDEIARADEQLSLGDCSIACQALGSMQHAADRLCALDPGPPCAGARSKVKSAAGRVRASCPECGMAGNESPPVATGTVDADKPAHKPAHKPENTPENAPVLAEERVAAAPPKGGGCAGCTVGGERGGAGGALALVLAWAIARLRRRGRRSP